MTRPAPCGAATEAVFIRRRPAWHALGLCGHVPIGSHRARWEERRSEKQWGAYFQARTLSAYAPEVTGTFAYADPFTRI